MTRHHGSTEISVAECIDRRFDTWRVRTDFKPYIDPETEEEMGVTFIETEFPYKPSLQEAKDFVLEVINAQTDYKILTGFIWNNKPVWLSAENQRNFSEGQRMAKEDSSILPITYKIGEYKDKTSVYHTFNTFEELDSFYKQAFGYINQCLKEGWQIKDNVDWTPYQDALEPVVNNEQ